MHQFGGPLLLMREEVSFNFQHQGQLPSLCSVSELHARRDGCYCLPFGSAVILSSRDGENA